MSKLEKAPLLVVLVPLDGCQNSSSFRLSFTVRHAELHGAGWLHATLHGASQFPKASAHQDRLAQIGMAQVGIAHICPTQVGFLEYSSFSICMTQVCVLEGGPDAGCAKDRLTARESGRAVRSLRADLLQRAERFLGSLR